MNIDSHINTVDDSWPVDDEQLELSALSLSLVQYRLKDD